MLHTALAMKAIVLAVLLTPVITGGGLALFPRAADSGAELPSPSLKQAAVVALATAATTLPAHPADTAQAQTIELSAAIQQGKITAEFRGNGREKLQALLTNRSNARLVIRVQAGQMFEADRNSVVVLRAGEVELRPGKPVDVTVQTAAVRAANRMGETVYQLSYGRLPRLDALFTYAQERPELSQSSLQTAVLALTENLPLSSVAKFSTAGGDLPTHFNTNAFRADAPDILHALIALRAIGIKESELALTVDPQLKIEAMIDPSTRTAAMRYYGITSQTEWDYWKGELLSGDPTTRHYALYGIARYYPDIALEMLPKWARETKTQNVFRISAIQALADTERPEALPILQRLSDEFGAATELGRTAQESAKYLSAHLAKIASNRPTVAFRGSSSLGQF